MTANTRGPFHLSPIINENCPFQHDVPRNPSYCWERVLVTSVSGLACTEQRSILLGNELGMATQWEVRHCHGPTAPRRFAFLVHLREGVWRKPEGAGAAQLKARECSPEERGHLSLQPVCGCTLRAPGTADGRGGLLLGGTQLFPEDPESLWCPAQGQVSVRTGGILLRDRPPCSFTIHLQELTLP